MLEGTLAFFQKHYVNLNHYEKITLIIYYHCLCVGLCLSPNPPRLPLASRIFFWSA